MGLRDLFGGGGKPKGKAKGKVAKLTKTASNQYTQSAERYSAMEQLMSIAAKDDTKTVEAYVGVLKRFTITSSKSIEDEEEKGWAYRRLSSIGKELMPALEAFCLESDNIAWALRLVEDVSDESQEWSLIDKLVEQHPPGYERDPSKKIQVLTHLSEIEDPQVPKILCRYLGDDDETVRFFAVESIIDFAEPSTCDDLVGRLADPKEDSLRLRGRVLDGLANLGWDVSAHVDTVTANLGSDHLYQGGKIVRR